MKHTLRNLSIAAAMSLALTAPAKAVPVDLELQLLVDVSGSVDDNEFALQRNGYVQAFQSQTIKDAITGGVIGKIAAQFIYWSGAAQQNIAVDWTEIDSDASSDAFATAISNAARPNFGFGSLTAPGSAMNFSSPLFANNFEGTTLVIDVSGDGEQNDGADTPTARDAALALGVERINGLPIGGDQGVEDFYADEIIGGTNAFLIPASSFNDFESAVTRKLEFEIRGETPVVPLPAGGWLILTAIGAFAALRRRKMAA